MTEKIRKRWNDQNEKEKERRAKDRKESEQRKVKTTNEKKKERLYQEKTIIENMVDKGAENKMKRWEGWKCNGNKVKRKELQGKKERMANGK